MIVSVGGALLESHEGCKCSYFHNACHTQQKWSCAAFCNITHFIGTQCFQCWPTYCCAGTTHERIDLRKPFRMPNAEIFDLLVPFRPWSAGTSMHKEPSCLNNVFLESDFLPRIHSFPWCVCRVCSLSVPIDIFFIVDLVHVIGWYTQLQRCVCMCLRVCPCMSVGTGVSMHLALLSDTAPEWEAGCL